MEIGLPGVFEPRRVNEGPDRISLKVGADATVAPVVVQKPVNGASIKDTDALLKTFPVTDPVRSLPPDVGRGGDDGDDVSLLMAKFESDQMYRLRWNVNNNDC